ncbi:hypothetical protein MYXO_03531 [Myxococcaceae bacterium]|jgi:hypothetical protein|nr:hypothetical protein MYXO_03531 [Myxococcaceae bacterium]
MRDHPFRYAVLAFIGIAASACGEIFGEVDKANDLASKPSGNRPAAAAAVPEPEPEAPGIVDRVQGLLGMGEPAKPGRRPPDPNDPMVLCRLGGSNSYMLKSGCINRRGTVVASKGPAH